MISKYTSHAFLFSMGEQNNERLSCEQGLFWEEEFQFLSTRAISASCARQQSPSCHLQQRLIMEKEMERNVQHGGNQRQQ